MYGRRGGGAITGHYAFLRFLGPGRLRDGKSALMALLAWVRLLKGQGIAAKGGIDILYINTVFIPI